MNSDEWSVGKKVKRQIRFCLCFDWLFYLPNLHKIKEESLIKITKRKNLSIIVDIVTKGLGRVTRRSILAACRHRFRPTGGLLAHRLLQGSAILEKGGAAIGRSVLGWDQGWFDNGGLYPPRLEPRNHADLAGRGLPPKLPNISNHHSAALPIDAAY